MSTEFNNRIFKKRRICPSFRQILRYSNDGIIAVLKNISRPICRARPTAQDDGKKNLIFKNGPSPRPKD